MSYYIFLLFFGGNVKYCTQSIFLWLAMGTSALVYGADRYYSVSYGIVQAAQDQPTAWYKPQLSGYTVRMIDSARFVRIVSKTEKILVGDCVAIDSNGEDSTIRRVENMKCQTAVTTLTSVSTQQMQNAGTSVNSNEITGNGETITAKTKENGRSSACDNALEVLKNTPFGPKRREARQHAASVCD